LYEDAGRWDEAAALLEKAIAAGPSNDALIGALSGLYARKGDLEKAEAVLSPRLQAGPKNVPIRSALASLYLEQKKYVAAAAEYTRVVAEHPDDAGALNNFGLGLSIRG
jgi:Tfp pilus assembly protein PilF